MSFGLIYKITSKTSGKSYVGQTTTKLDLRWKKHLVYARRGGSSNLAAAIRKYGESDFDLCVLEECSSEEELNQAEVAWIAKLDTLNEGYNLTTGGERPIWSSEARQRFSENHRLRGVSGEDHPAFGHRHSEETKKIIAEAIKKRPILEETRKKRSLILKEKGGIPWSAERKKKLSEKLKSDHPSRGKRWSPDVIERMRQGHLNKGPHTEEHRENIGKALAGKPKTPEHKAKLAEAAKRRWAKTKQK